MDDELTIGNLRAAVHRFVDAREWYQYHSPKNLSMCIAIEAAEIMEHFQWQSPAESDALLHDPIARAGVADELADVMIYCLSFANSTGIDVSDAVLRKLERNETRFPIERVRGKLGDS